MNDLRRFEFFSKERRDPHIQHLIDFQINDKEGFIHFDGYYYVMNEELPKRVFFNTIVKEENVYEENETDNIYKCKYRIIEDNFYEVEIYDRIKMMNTSSYDEIEEDDGSKMRICYFPTHEQKILFRVINIYQTFEDFLNGMTDSFKQEENIQEL